MRSATRLTISRVKLFISTRRPCVRRESEIMFGKKQQHRKRVQQWQLRRRTTYETNLKQQQAAANVKLKSLLLKQMQAGARFVERQGNGLRGEHHRAAAHDQSRQRCCPCCQQGECCASTELEAQVQRLNEGRIWARIRKEETKRNQAEEARRVFQKQIDQQTKKLSVRSQKVAKERQELAGLRFRCKELQEKNADYQ
eukprot:6214004-Pleurochrysis_carterae.AAC.1